MTVRFAAKIHIIPSIWAFEKHCDQAPGPQAGYPWSAKTRVWSKENAWTDGICDCNAGGFASSKQAMVFHLRTEDYWWTDKGKLLPDKDVASLEEIKAAEQFRVAVDPSQYRTALVGDHKVFQEEDPNIRGLITGGCAKYDSSRYLRDLLIETYDALKIPFSLLWGGYRKKALHYSRPEDTWTIQFPAYHLELEKDSPLERLKHGFSHIAIDPGDELWVQGHHIPAEVLAKEGFLKTTTPKAEVS